MKRIGYDVNRKMSFTFRPRTSMASMMMRIIPYFQLFRFEGSFKLFAYGFLNRGHDFLILTGEKLTSNGDRSYADSIKKFIITGP